MAYLDDILIYSEMLEEYKEHVEKSLEYTITPGYMERDDWELAAIRKWPVSTAVKQVQLFLGFANFYQRFQETKLPDQAANATIARPAFHLFSSDSMDRRMDPCG